MPLGIPASQARTRVRRPSSGQKTPSIHPPSIRHPPFRRPHPSVHLSIHPSLHHHLLLLLPHRGQSVSSLAVPHRRPRYLDARPGPRPRFAFSSFRVASAFVAASSPSRHSARCRASRLAINHPPPPRSASSLPDFGGFAHTITFSLFPIVDTLLNSACSLDQSIAPSSFRSVGTFGLLPVRSYHFSRRRTTSAHLSFFCHHSSALVRNGKNQEGGPDAAAAQHGLQATALEGMAVSAFRPLECDARLMMEIRQARPYAESGDTFVLGAWHHLHANRRNPVLAVHVGAQSDD